MLHFICPYRSFNFFFGGTRHDHRWSTLLVADDLRADFRVDGLPTNSELASIWLLIIALGSTRAIGDWHFRLAYTRMRL
jgi:hypothetical protein